MGLYVVAAGIITKSVAAAARPTTAPTYRNRRRYFRSVPACHRAIRPSDHQTPGSQLHGRAAAQERHWQEQKACGRSSDASGDPVPSLYAIRVPLMKSRTIMQGRALHRQSACSPRRRRFAEEEATSSRGCSSDVCSLLAAPATAMWCVAWRGVAWRVVCGVRPGWVVC